MENDEKQQNDEMKLSEIEKTVILVFELKWMSFNSIKSVNLYTLVFEMMISSVL